MFWLPAASQTLLHNSNSKRKGLGLQKLDSKQVSIKKESSGSVENRYLCWLVGNQGGLGRGTHCEGKYLLFFPSFIILQKNRGLENGLQIITSQSILKRSM